MRRTAPALTAALAVTMGLIALFGCSAEKAPQEKRLTIGFSNDMQGEIRSCGCASNDYGGLGRRATFLETVRDSTADLLLVDGGGFFGVELNYGQEKAELTLKSLQLMGYDAVVLGDEELGFGTDYIVNRSREIGLPVVVANLWDSRSDTLLFPPTKELELSTGMRVGIIGVMGERLRIPPQARGTVRLTSALGAARRHAVEMRERVDVIVLLAHVNRGQALSFAREIGEIDVIVHGSEGRVMRKVKPVDHTYILQVSSQGRYMGVAHGVLGTDGRMRSMVTDIQPLSQRYADDDRIAKLFSVYDLNIATKEKTDVPAGVFASRRGVEKPFAGADQCRECHEEIDAQWKGTVHARAMDRLTNENRQYDRDCTPCHSTGFYERGGFESVAKTPQLANVQCEACHGNGHDHVEDPDRKMPGDPRAACRGCHTVEQSPEFDFGEFWRRIEH